MACNARCADVLAASESGPQGSSIPFNSAPCTSTFCPMNKTPRRSCSVRWRSHRACIPYQPSVSSRCAHPSFAPERLTAATHKTTGDLAGVSRSNTRRTHGLCARRISRSYL